MMPRLIVHIPEDLDQRLRRYVQKRGGLRPYGFLSKVVKEALEEYLKSKGE